MSSIALPKPRHRWFAALYSKFIEPMDRKRMAPMRQFAAGGAVGRVLEIGAGTGANIEHYDWSKVESLEITEPDPFMLERLQPKLEALPADVRSRVHLQEIPAEQLPFPDASFDVAVVTLVLCTVMDPARSIAELRRVLKPGGELRLIEHVRAQGFWGSVQRLFQPIYGRISGDCQLRRDTEQALRDAGFDVEVTQRLVLGGPLWPTFVGLARLKA
jgi:ubiquinone/menaquinone biosynthesis C-methylase UbiE